MLRTTIKIKIDINFQTLYRVKKTNEHFLNTFSLKKKIIKKNVNIFVSETFCECSFVSVEKSKTFEYFKIDAIKEDCIRIKSSKKKKNDKMMMLPRALSLTNPQ